ncbi:type 1 glutamine amidotransferase [Streptomyces tubbatahanensis]|uniref:Type 1 glutamine amidotransferase n=1 Tax=Streptomyces tubbatahanensis TaxID=2923272 RepID=A0ABY3Y0Z0_9ACTN|nr:type 1 glutamine amidotransferase [Streptomyces tubbatahanensis]UNT00257.1 type 1 glutamine amidotransferase [Streptomyces tubbatahanensis]
MRVLAVQNTPRGGPGRVGDWLEESGLAVDVVHAYEGEAVPSRLTRSALVVLGGGFMPDDDARAPWLAATRGLVAAALAERTPLLGICLGGQMLAHVAGGKVAAGHGAPEMGSTALSVRAEAAADPLFHSLPERVTAIERHVDAVTSLPPGAVWLARSDRCPYQAFRVGERAWGVQFHPETAPERLLTWDAARLAAHGHDRRALYRGAEEDARTATPVWREVTRRFAALVREEAEAER